jgi:hypothetical protein
MDTAFHNGLSREEIADFLRRCLVSAEKLGISHPLVLRMASRSGISLSVKHRSSLSRFARGKASLFGSERNTRNLYKFFIATELGRAILSTQGGQLPLTVPGVRTAAAKVVRGAHPDQAQAPNEAVAGAHAYQFLINALLSRADIVYQEEIIGNYLGYHAGLNGDGYTVRAIRIGRGEDGLIWFEDYLSSRYCNKGLVFCGARRPQFISIDAISMTNLRFFAPDMFPENDQGSVIMMGPMTTLTTTPTRDEVVANRYMRMVKSAEQDFAKLLDVARNAPLEKFDEIHRNEFNLLLAFEAGQLSPIIEVAKTLGVIELLSYVRGPSEIQISLGNHSDRSPDEPTSYSA